MRNSELWGTPRRPGIREPAGKRRAQIFASSPARTATESCPQQPLSLDGATARARGSHWTCAWGKKRR